jgi:hypothetical protein
MLMLAIAAIVNRTPPDSDSSTPLSPSYDMFENTFRWLGENANCIIDSESIDYL